MSIVYGDFHAYPNMGCLSIGRVLLDSSMFSEYFTTFDNIGVGIEGVPATQTGQAHFILHYDKRWRYDSVLFDQLGTPVCALEVVNTHYSNQEKIDSTRSNNQQCMGFAEFMADDVLESTNGWLHNIRTLEYPDCPRCKEIAAAAANKQRLAIAAENERRRLAVLAELERRLAFVEKLQKNKKKRMQQTTIVM